jgi:pimeloyl-ACP methyl ester carboxylesterase
MPIYTYKNIRIAYHYQHPTRMYDSSAPVSKSPLLLLHGWGTNKETFAALMDAMQHALPIYALDFPGFGESDEPDTPWQLDDYAAMVTQFIEALHLEAPIVLGHSFGGRVAIKLSQKMPLAKLILTNSAGIKPRRTASYYLKVYGFKLVRMLNAVPGLHFMLDEPVKAYGEKYSSADYKAASPMMKRVLSAVVNEDLTPLLSKIDVPVLLIWGDQDTATPLDDAQIMAAHIPDSGLVVFEGAGHFSYLEQPLRFSTILKTFIGG